MLGKRIQEIRKSLGWSQVLLAQKLGVTKQTVSNWENDNIQPSVEMLVRLSRILGASTDYLLGLEKGKFLNVEGIPQNIVAHLMLLIEDFKEK